MRLGLLFALVILLMAGPAGAEGLLRADEGWTFCSSADFDTRRAFVTDPFAEHVSRQALEVWFAKSLSARGIAPTAVQCPAPGEHDRVVLDHERAEQFLHDLGFTVVHVHPSAHTGS